MHPQPIKTWHGAADSSCSFAHAAAQIVAKCTSRMPSNSGVLYECPPHQPPMLCAVRPLQHLQRNSSRCHLDTTHSTLTYVHILGLGVLVISHAINSTRHTATSTLWSQGFAAPRLIAHNLWSICIPAAVAAACQSLVLCLVLGGQHLGRHLHSMEDTGDMLLLHKSRLFRHSWVVRAAGKKVASDW